MSPVGAAAQRADSVHVREGVNEGDYVAMREARDAKLAAPLLLMPSIRVNIRPGKPPLAETQPKYAGRAGLEIVDASQKPKPLPGARWRP